MDDRVAAMKPATSASAILADERGFTLLEMLICLAIMSIAGVAVALSAGGLQARSGFRTTLMHVDELLSASRTQALLLGSPAALTVDTSTRELRSADRKIALPAGIDLTITGATTGRASAKSIVFFPDGSSSGGVLTLQADEMTAIRRVSWLTGEIRRD